MKADVRPAVRCAIYTRKSSEEGLEQSFNSLDAQREACEAFILSQRHEGWKMLPTRYDDGGYSGGTLERPALKRLLEDVQAKRVNVIVVYKVDRLTRSLGDFAKIVESLDARAVSFVSVTQQFNTTTSMGRLTLNVLLSFAQFEREVTGERIRDKIAASKKKGMWMGGPIPLGYKLEERKLTPHPIEAAFVNKVFALYVELGCVLKLAAHLRHENVRTKIWTTKAGKRVGGGPFARGHLYYLLRNRLYVGEIRHRERWYPGEHPGIVARELWDKVQAKLDSNLRTHRNRLKQQSSSLLTGWIKDGEGNRFTPSFTIRRGRRYRYYVSQPVARKVGLECKAPTRMPAHELESRIIERVQEFLRADAEIFERLSVTAESPASLHSLVSAAKKLAAKLGAAPSNDLRVLLEPFLQSVIVQENNIQVVLSATHMRELLESGGQISTSKWTDVQEAANPSESICLTIETKRKRYGGEIHLVVPPKLGLTVQHPRPALIKAVARGHVWSKRILEGKVDGLKSLACEAGLTPQYVRGVLSCAFLAPDIVEAILEGRQPLTLKFANLYKHIPLSWAEQRRKFGFLPEPTSVQSLPG